MTSRLLKTIIFGLVMGIIGLILSYLNPLFSLEENSGLGLLFKLRGEKEPPADVVVVSIDKESSDQLGIPDNPDKWPRSLHAQLTETLKREGARVVAFDLHFIEPRVPDDDIQFARSVRTAQNVVLCEPMKSREIPLGDRDAGAVHSIVKIVKPIPIFSEAAVATAPFPLPRIPFKVNSYWAFQTGAGDSPTLPVVTFQLFCEGVYSDLIVLMAKVSTDHAGRLLAGWAQAIRVNGVKGVIREIREIFESDSTLAPRMLEELERSKSLSSDDRKYQLLKALIKLYAGPSSRYVNYYGPPRTVTTIPYYQALKIRDGAVDGKPVDIEGKAVFVGLSEVIPADRKDSFYTVYSNARGVV